MQQVKDTVMELREIVFGEHNIDIEKYAVELSNRSFLSFDEIKNIFNNLSLIYIQFLNPRLNQSKKKIWETFEDELMNQYIELAIRNGAKKRKALSDLSDILIDRTESSIAFRYYHLSEPKRTASEKVVVKERQEEKLDNTDDLLDVVVDIVANVEKAGVDLNSLFKGILTLSEKAVQSTNVDKLEALEGENEFLKVELDKEKDKNESLQRDVAELIKQFESLKNEIYYFDGLNGKQKLQQLGNFNKNIKYIVDKFGGVISVTA